VAAAVALAAPGAIQVRFVEPEKFSDLKDNSGFRRLGVLKEIEAHFVEQAARRLPGQELRIEVTDVDLAGEVEPWGRRGEWLRVMRTITVPGIHLRYELLQGGQVVRQGESQLRDLDYQSGWNAYSSGDPLRYERRMIDRWLDREFGAAVATVTPKP
jgi:hypothetical protein